MKLVMLIKMYLNKSYSSVQAGKHLSEMFPIRNGLKQGGAVLPLLFNYAIRRVQVNQDDLKLNGIHQLLVHADDVNIMGGRIQTTTKNTEALVASKETGL